MECLGIPIDHRLRQLIRKAQSINANGDSEHIRILQRFGKFLENGQSDYFSTYGCFKRLLVLEFKKSFPLAK